MAELIKRQITLAMDGEEKRTLIRALEKYLQQFSKGEKKENKQCALSIIREEKESAFRLISQIDDQWNALLPSLQIFPSIVSNNTTFINNKDGISSLLKSLDHLRSGHKGLIMAMSAGQEPVEITYDSLNTCFILKINNEVVFQSEDPIKVSILFHSLT